MNNYNNKQNNSKKKILITGATGNIGKEIIHSISNINREHEIITGVRDIEKSKQIFKAYPDLQYRNFDFDDENTFQTAFSDINTLFLLRPPHISQVEKYFIPLIESAKKYNIKEIVFLSVQGADKTSYIPHSKIEKIIVASGINYVFIRPSYFMQNLTTTLAEDLRRKEIILPAGKALFNWIDTTNIGEVATIVLTKFEDYINKAIELTGNENLNFQDAVDKINDILHTNLKYKNTNLFSFFSQKKRQGIKTPMIIVMIMLHFFPRFQKPPKISDNYKLITGKEPTSFTEYVRKDKMLAQLLRSN